MMLCERHPGSELRSDIGFLVQIIGHLLPAHDLESLTLSFLFLTLQWVGNEVSVSWVTTATNAFSLTVT